ncbi:MAG: YicC family protein [Deltaproteobacteria bacterium]|nr:YicC family protein [Deltaproteobacteria bacterium]MBW1920834.1 YicC family protein [Deltaproteobacteria bacterium]MBW1936396.1 YicC family protein [Deltaproteobacteria bacterium]MBW1978955.1 YicC family protein [Deltaproteobacteria bacterium]MBW2044459.1 YicC family protein [Deltaproteobacteria bacterium]
MIKSMTGYGRGETRLGQKVFSAEIKSTNYRYRDVIIRLPRSYQQFEEELRAHVSERTSRGRIEVFFQVEGQEGGGDSYELELNLPLVRAYFRIFRQLKEEFGVEEKVSAEQLCQMKDIITYKPEEADLEEAKRGFHEALEAALDSFDAMKVREGSTIEKDFIKRLSRIEGYLEEVRARAPLVVEEYRNNLRDRITRISPDIQLDEGRLVQEVAIFADRCDISEEVTRAKSHLDQFRHYLDTGEAVGRRLDFLIQEINRETNTMSSKASDQNISARAVEIKAELEKLREQVQNVE